VTTLSTAVVYDYMTKRFTDEVTDFDALHPYRPSLITIWPGVNGKPRTLISHHSMVLASRVLVNQLLCQLFNAEAKFKPRNIKGGSVTSIILAPLRTIMDNIGNVTISASLKCVVSVPSTLSHGISLSRFTSFISLISSTLVACISVWYI
jgi:hypothetical protein